MLLAHSETPSPLAALVMAFNSDGVTRARTIYVAVLGNPPVDSPVAAVRAWLVRKARNEERIHLVEAIVYGLRNNRSNNRDFCGLLLYFASSNATFYLFAIPVPIRATRLLRIGVTYVIEGKK